MQATLPFPAATLPAPLDDATGFEIGWDYAHYRMVPAADHLHEGHPVRQGWEAGVAVFGTRTLRATPQVRKWLQLRLNAWLRGRVFEGVQVTPNYLGQIEVPTCPITREQLTHGTGLPSDASVDRVCNRAGYAAGNLAVMSVRANAAKSSYDWDDAMAFSRQIEKGQLGQIDGLDAAQWARLAVLMSFVTPLPHAQAACLPLLALPTRRLRVLNAVQSLQVMLTLQFAQPGRAPRTAALAALVPAAARHEFHVFMTTLLAHRVAAGRLQGEAVMRRSMEDAWSRPLVNSRWQRFALQLTAADCERIVRRAADRGLIAGGWRYLTFEQATEGWSLASGGYVTSAQATPGQARSPWRLDRIESVGSRYFSPAPSGGASPLGV